MRLAVLTLALNCLEYTQRAVASVMASVPWSTILIDQGSTDGTREWARDVVGVRHLHYYIRNEMNVGVSKGWNQGIEFAFRTGHDTVVVINNDVELAHDCIDNLIQWRAQGLGLPTVHPVTVRNQDELAGFRRSQRYILPTDFCGFLVDRTTIGKVGVFDEGFVMAYWEDVDFDHRVKLAGLTRGQCMNALVRHHRSTTVRKGGVKYLDAFIKNREYLVRKWGKIPDRCR